MPRPPRIEQPGLLSPDLARQQPAASLLLDGFAAERGQAQEAFREYVLAAVEGPAVSDTVAKRPQLAAPAWAA
jgi:hypothetical protein